MSATHPTASDRPRPGRPFAGRARAVVIVAALMALVGIALAVGAPAMTRAPASAGALPPPRFVEEARAAGVEHRYDGEYTTFVGGGVAAFDCDDDTRPDLFFAGGERPAALFRNRTAPGEPLRFERVADPATDLETVTGAYPLDIDGDRIVDLAVLRLGEDVILRGLGDCRFERANEALGILDGETWTVGFSASWETPAARLPTLAFGDYVTLDEEREATSDCPPDRLIRPAADGRSYVLPAMLAPSWCTLSMLFSDWDRSGRRDLRVSNDRHYYRDGEEQLWRIAAGEAPRMYDRADGWARLRIWGMGIASQDLTGDGSPEVYLTSQGDNKLQTLADGSARPIFEDIALRRGVTAHRPYTGGDPLPSTAWHPAFEDVNNDGFTDLFVTKGNVDGQTDHAMRDPSNLFIGQPDGTFVEGAIAAGIADFSNSRGAAVVDLDGDGLLDIVRVVRRQNVQLWRNTGSGEEGGEARPMGHWLAVDLEQDAPNHGGVGAWIAVRSDAGQVEREVTVGGGHASGQLVPLHFGLGSATRAEVRVTWPDGEIGPWIATDVDRTVRVTRGASTAEPVAR